MARSTDGPRDGGPAAGERDRLRARLYTADATDEDRRRYEALLAQAERPGGPGDREPDAPVHDAAGPRRSPLRPRLVAVGIAGMAAGLVLGSLVTLAVARSTRVEGVGRSTPMAAAAGAASLPRPVAATPLGGNRSERTAREEALLRAFRLPDSSARIHALSSIASSGGAPADVTWMDQHACSQAFESMSASPTGLRSGTDPRGRTTTGPSGTHFRIRILMTRPASWSWAVHGRTGSASEATVSLGAGGAESGSAQYAEFDTAAVTAITAVDVVTTPSTPFLWTIDGCTSG